MFNLGIRKLPKSSLSIVLYMLTQVRWSNPPHGNSHANNDAIIFLVGASARLRGFVVGVGVGVDVDVGVGVGVGVGIDVGVGVSVGGSCGRTATGVGVGVGVSVGGACADVDDGAGFATCVSFD